MINIIQDIYNSDTLLTIKQNNLVKLRKLHKHIMISQFSKYGNIKLKFPIITKIVMMFFQFDFFRSFFYKIKKKI